MNNISGQNDFQRQLETVNRMLQAGRAREEKPLFSKGTKTALATIALLGPLTTALFSCNRNEFDFHALWLQNIVESKERQINGVADEIKSACADLESDEVLCNFVLNDYKNQHLKNVDRELKAEKITKVQALIEVLFDYDQVLEGENVRLKSILYTKLKQCETKEKLQQLNEDSEKETREKIRRFEKNPNRKKNTPVKHSTQRKH
jgi:uncharacterized phage infection (PIP) family protein YhgE